MQRIQLPALPYEVSRVCLGTAQFGDCINEYTAFELLDDFVRMGGNFLDTANVYARWTPSGENRGEQILGRWLKSRGVRDVIVATKGCHHDVRRPQISRVREECAREDAESSLRALGLEVLPLYWLHRDDESRPIEEIIEFCEKLKREGKILRYGLSNYRTDRIRTALAYADRMGYERIFAVSNEWSLAAEHAPAHADPTGMRQMDAEEYALHCAENLPVIPFTAAAQGYFARLDAGEELRKNQKRFDCPENRALLPMLRAIAAQQGVCAADAAVGYLLQQPFPVVPIVSTSRREHLAAFAHISAMKFDIAALRRFG